MICPEHICVTGLLKAVPAEEGGERILYMQASDESRDYDNEVVMCKALSDSAAYFLQFGNIDIDHITLRGARDGIPNYNQFEVGVPIDVQVQEPRTMVKARIYSGSGPAAAQANLLWDSLTKLSPPARWYPSVGGEVLATSQFLNEDGSQGAAVSKVRWSNIGLSKTPVNLALPTVATMPMATFAKAWTPDGLDLMKALTAMPSTDIATLSGGAALTRQSLDQKVKSYWDFRESVAAAMLPRIRNPTAERIIRFATDVLGLAADQAAEWAERFMSDLNRNRLRRKT